MTSNNVPTTVLIRMARSGDINTLKKLADDNRNALGFLPRAKLETAIQERRVLVGIVGRKLAGFVIFRHRKTDLQTTLSDICVAAQWRGCGVGKALVETLKADSINLKRAFIHLKCPVDLEANRFYERLGFRCIAVENGRARRLNVWQFDLPQTVRI